jgi:hypothetical protein
MTAERGIAGKSSHTWPGCVSEMTTIFERFSPTTRFQNLIAPPFN